MESVSHTEAGPRLVWSCEICRRPIADGEGYLCVDLRAVGAYERAVWAWEKRVRAKSPGGLFIYSCTELRDYPKPVPWQTLHRECDPAPESPDYHFGVEQIREPADVIRMAAHLFEKPWVAATSWGDLMRGCADEFAA